MPDQHWNSSRRQFVKSMAAAVAAVQTGRPLSASVVRSLLAGADVNSNSHSLDSGWEFSQGAAGRAVGGLARRGSCCLGKGVPSALLQSLRRMRSGHALLPRPRMVRTRTPILNPLRNGRTLLYFEGAGQSANVYVGNSLVGNHVGGYDEFVFDITDAVSSAATATTVNLAGTDKSGVAIAVLCDNSQNLECSPSDLSDFSLYGGLYRHVHLVYVPSVSLESVHIVPSFVPGSPANVSVKARLYNPSQFSGSTTVTVQVTDANGKAIHQSSKSIPAWQDETELTAFSIEAPALWSPGHPHLYTCKVSLTTDLAAARWRNDSASGTRSSWIAGPSS